MGYENGEGHKVGRLQWLKKTWDRRLFARGAAGMALVLLVLYFVNALAPAVAYPPSRLAGSIRDGTPGGLATAAIEAGVRLSNRTGLGFLEHAALALLAAAAHAVWIALGGVAALAIGAGATPARKARRGLVVAAVMFGLACLLAAGSPEGLRVFSGTVYAGASLAFGRFAAKRSVFRITEPKIKGEETPLDALRRSRRRFLRRAGAAIGGLVGGAALTAYLTRPDRSAAVRIASADERFVAPPPDPSFDQIAGLTGEVTPTEDFYNIDINITKPSVDHESWKMAIEGLVDRPFSLDYRELQNRFSVVEMASTLSCISNEVGGDLVSTAVWRGIRLKDVLQAAGLQAGARELIFRAADGYSDSISLAKGLEDDTLIAFGMNGTALPRRNGFPARMVIPGIYGMKNVKWLTGIEVSGRNYVGYWQKRGWSDLATVKTQSRIDIPESGTTPGPDLTVAGVAWAGDRGITKVEVSDDGGDTWRPATLKRELAPNAWRLWTTELAGRPGRRKIEVRATDGRGAVQGKRRTKTHPNGASGLDSVSVQQKN